MIITILVGNLGNTFPRRCNDPSKRHWWREQRTRIENENPESGGKKETGGSTWRGDPTRSGDSSLSRYAKLDGSVTPPVVPWSCCRIDVKGPCFHDPLQLPNPEQNSSYESLNPRGCLAPMRIMLNGTLHSAAVMIAFLFVLQVHRLYLVDRD